MAGSSMAFQYDDVGTIKKIIIDWVSDDGAGVAGSCIFDTKKISGLLLKGITDPDGAAVPTLAYDIVLTDPEGGNILDNCAVDLINRSNVNVETTDFIIRDLAANDACGSGERPSVTDVITVSITNAGNSTEGRLILYWMGSV